MLLLTGDDVRAVLDPVELRRSLADGYQAISDGRTDVPTRIKAETAKGFLAAMPGYVEGVGLAAKLVSVFPGNVDLPTHLALVALFDEDTGVPLALIDGEVITELRTAASAALACDLLAPTEATVLTVIGAGVQAAGHLVAFASVRPWTEIRLTNRTPAHARALAERVPGVTVVDDIDAAVDGADVVACTTDTPTPLFDAGRFTGTHLSSVGIHREIPSAVLEDALVVVQTRAAVSTPPPNGPPEIQGWDPGAVVELGEIVAERRAGRTEPRQVTAWLSVGHAMEDVVAARLAHDRATAAGLGRTLEM
jgi:alanine dehydrogenase